MPTRLYFSSLDRTNLTPPFSGGTQGWSGTTGATRWLMMDYHKNTPVTTGPTIDLNAAANHKHLDRQYISAPLMGQQLISGITSGQLMVRYFAATDNCDQICCCLKLTDYYCRQDKGILLRLSGHVPTVEFISNATLRNKVIISGKAVTPRTGAHGDRLVLEIGYQATLGGTSPQAAAKWGDGGADLPQNESQTTDAPGWFHFDQVTLNFQRGHRFLSIG
jgi:hypothetical protein